VLDVMLPEMDTRAFSLGQRSRIRRQGSAEEIRVLAEQWRVHYNTVRPHSSLGYRPPAPEAWMAKSLGYGEVETATRFPLLHTPDCDYQCFDEFSGGGFERCSRHVFLFPSVNPCLRVIRSCSLRNPVCALAVEHVMGAKPFAASRGFRFQLLMQFKRHP
jgi:Integrase core domain